MLEHDYGDRETKLKKGKVKPRTGHEGPEAEQRYSCTLSLTSALDGGGWSTPRPGRFAPGNNPVPIVQEAGQASGPVWTGSENLELTGIRSPDRPARSESLNRLRYPVPHRETRRVNTLAPNCCGINTIWFKITEGVSVMKGGEVSDISRNSATSWHSQCLDDE